MKNATKAAKFLFKESRPLPGFCKPYHNLVMGTLSGCNILFSVEKIFKDHVFVGNNVTMHYQPCT